MTEKMLARVAVSSVPYAADRLYTYLVPDELIGSAEAGKRVTIPFGRGNRRVEGFLLEVGREAATSPLKPIDAVLGDAPLLDAKDIRLVRWMKARYFCTYYDAIKAILPGGVWLQYRELWHVNGEISAEDALSSVAPDSLEETLLRAMLSAKEIERGALDLLGGEKTAKALRSLEACGLAVRETKLRQRLQDKSVRMVSLCVSAEDALAAVEPKRRSAPVRYAVVELLSREGCLSSSEISYYTGATMQTLRGLKKAGLVEFSEREVLRVSRYDDAPAREDIVLNGEQQAAFDGLCTLLGREGGSAALLHGVTASGKTQVYIRLIEEALTRGKTAMLLVPEIALTPQMLRRFTAQFGSDVAMLHSALPLTERYDQWKRIRRGEVRVVLGTRSAVFAPLQNLGLIIMDEEQEHTYQSESAPRFDAHDVAKKRAVMENALLLFASATPLTETYHAAESGKLQLVQLTHRYGGRPLPSVDFIDMRAELAAGNPREVSVRLARELQENLDNGEQSILLLNRRGYRTIGMCTTCGHVLKCPNCSVPLVYHKPQQALLCHHCGHTVHPLPQTCPECGGKISYSGFGTQRVEEELAELLPGARILRMDQDSTSRKDAHETMLAQFARHEYDILLGTQMVAKGLDFEKVTLVGVLGIDSLLFGQGFRAYESVFSLITQVVGRGGRAALPGRALIQTSVPDHPVLQLAAAQDYKGFYREEITFRRFSLYPPFCSFVVVGFIGDQEGAVFIAAQRFGALLGQHAAQKPNIPLRILGPAPMNITMLNNKFRYKLTLKCRNDAAFRALLHETLDAYDAEKLPQKASVILDFNSDGDL